MKHNWEKIGEIGVDAGLCWIGDPRYILHKETPPKAIGASWGDFCDNLLNGEHPTAKQFDYDLGHSGLGVCVSTGLGDGTYDVLARISDEGDWGRRIAEIRVVFIPGDQHDDEASNPTA